MPLRKVGDWTRAINVSRSLGEIGQQAKEIAMKRLSNKANAFLKDGINGQYYAAKEKYPALSLKWAKRKKSDKFYIYKGKYRRAIRSGVTKTQSGRTVAFVNLANWSSSRNKNFSMQSLAETLEDGASGINGTGAKFVIPARPLWKPAMRRVERWQASGINSPAKIALEILKRKAGK